MGCALESSLSLAIWQPVGLDISEGREVFSWGRRGKCPSARLCHAHGHQAAPCNPALRPPPHNTCPEKTSRCRLSKHAAGLRHQ